MTMRTLVALLRARKASPRNERRRSLPMCVEQLEGREMPVAGLVAAYGFEEGSGLVARDGSGNNHTGTIRGARYTAGRFGNALAFDGVGSWVTVADSKMLDLRKGMTLEAWVLPSGANRIGSVLMKERASNSLAYALYAADNTLRPSGLVSTGSGRSGTTGGPVLPLDAWAHLTATYDGSRLQLYVNGDLVSSRNVTGNLAATDGALRIGGNAVWGDYFSGLIDEVRVYNRALTQAEIRTDMHTAVEPPPPAPTAYAGIDLAGDEGSAVQFAASATGTGLTYAWDFGDGQGATGTLNPTHVYADDGDYTATLSVTDSLGRVATDTAVVRVRNVSPTATFTDDNPAPEGGIVRLIFGIQQDPSSADTSVGFRYSFDFDNDGTFDLVDVTTSTVSYTFPDNGDYPVRGQITDKDGGANEYTTLVEVTNVAPTATFTGPGQAGVGEPATFTFTNPQDPSPPDAAAGFRYSYDFNNDGIFDVVGSSTASASYAYPAAGTYTVRGRIGDKDGGFTDYTTTMIVTSAPSTARTFYVATTGDDNSPGTSATPWRTLQHAADQARAGDLIVVRSGNYAGFVLGWGSQQNGTADNPITFRGEPGATITSRNSTTPDGINLEGTSYVVVEGFTITNDGSITRAGIRSVLNDHVTIRNNTVDGMGRWGIFTGFSADVLIENNVTSRSGLEHGIYVSNSADNPVIRGNTVWGNNASGIQINADVSMGGDGIITNALVENNVVYDNGRAGGAAINLDGVQSSRVQNNLLYNNHATGIALFRQDGAEGSKNNVIVNNTVLVPSDGRWALLVQNGSTGNRVLNNILHNDHAFRGSINLSLDSLLGFVSDYNAVLGRFTTDGGLSVLTMALWQATGLDLHSLVATPAQLFVNAAANNYHLSATSPAINLGTASQAPATDFEGDARPAGAGIDIGADEYQSASAPSAGPTANAGADKTSNEGSSVGFVGSATGTGLIYLWDFGDGSSARGTLTPSHAYADNGTYTATLTVTDSLGRTATDSAIITVGNVSPHAIFRGEPTATVGTSIPFTFGNQTDPSSTDVAAGFRYSYDFNNDGVFDVIDSPNATASYTFAAVGTYTVKGRIKDKDGGYTDSTTIVTVSSGEGLQSPTGRNPLINWTPQQQATWDRMRRENHPWWQLIKNNANLTGTPGQRYNDYGQWALLVYQITGDTAYAAKAYLAFDASLMPTPWDRNYSREYFAEFVMMYDWLLPALTADQRNGLLNDLKNWGDLVLRDMSAGWGTRTGDSDEVVGHYFGLALLDQVAGTNYLGRTWTDVTIKSVGGLDATGANHETMRNAIKVHVERSVGGHWIESSDYNLGTLKLLILGTQGLKTATGVDHFPEVTAYLKQAALAHLYEFTSDLEAAHQWGDEEHPRELSLYKRVTLLGMLAGVNQDDPQVGPYVNRLVSELAAKYGYTGSGTAEPWARIFYFYNPYAAQAEWRTALPVGRYSPGMGLLQYHAGWDAADSFFGAQMTTRTLADHEIAAFGDFQLYRNGEWGVTHPLGYSGPAVSGEGNNSMLIAGLSSGVVRGPVVEAQDPNGGWAYLVGTTSGDYYDQPYWDPPPEFLHEWTRSLFYLPSANGASDTVLVFDRVNADDPELLPKLDRYYPDARTAITTAPALKQWIIHTPVAPTLTSAGISWTTAGGQQVQVSTLQPLNQTRTVYDEKALWAGYWNFFPSQLGYQVRIMPTQDRQWDTFLNVVQVSDLGAVLNNVGVRSLGGEASGALVQRGGQDDTLVMFGAQQSGRVLSSGYTVQFTPSTPSTNLYLMDLDPSHNWWVRVNGGTPQLVPVSAQGMGQVTVNGSGAITLEVIAA